MILSLIVPVYNVEKHIDRCLKSLVKQNLKHDEYEIIIIIDGSVDKSYLICESYKKLFNNIKIVYQENQGLSAARNTGILHAKGKYLWFIDSDDTIEINILRIIAESILKYETDIVNIGFTYIKNKDENILYLPNNKLQIEVIKTKSFLKDFDFKPMAWSYIFKTSFLLQNNLNFQEGILHEDEEFTLRIICYSKNILIFNLHIYNYYLNENSIMSGFKTKSTFDKFKILDTYEHLIKSSKIHSQYIDFINYRAFIIIYSILMPDIFFRHNSAEKSEIVRLIKSSHFYPFKRNPFFKGKQLIYRLMLNFNIKYFLALRNIR